MLKNGGFLLLDDVEVHSVAELYRPNLGKLQIRCACVFFIGFTSADSLISSNAGRCRATLASSWMETAAMLASEA